VPESSSIRFIAISVLALCLGACGAEDPSSPAAGKTVADYLSSASVDSMPGSIQDSGLPRPGTEGPVISVDGHLTIVNGGTATLRVTSPMPFETVYIAASAPVSPLFAQVSGIFEIPMPAPTTSADLLLVFPQDLPANEFDLYFAAADSSGRYVVVAVVRPLTIERMLTAPRFENIPMMAVFDGSARLVARHGAAEQGTGQVAAGADVLIEELAEAGVVADFVDQVALGLGERLQGDRHGVR
jgi:hypothetical protein